MSLRNPFQIRIFLFLSYSFGTETINTFIHSLVPSKTILDSRPKWAKSIPVFRPKRRKNPTWWGGTYVYGLYKGVPPPPGPKRRHPCGVVDFSLHFCLRNEQWIYTRVHYEISAGSVFLNLMNVWIEISSTEIFSISSYIKNCSQKFTDSLNAIWYRLQVTEETNGLTFQTISSWMELESWPGSNPELNFFSVLFLNSLLN